MTNRIAAVAGLILLLLVSPSIAADQPTELPDDLQELLPADPAVLIAVSSFEDLETNWNDLVRGWQEDEEETVDLRSLLAEPLPRFEEIVDPARPMALAVDMIPVMMGQTPWLTLVVPLKQDFTDRDDLGLEKENVSTVIQGDYLAIHSAPGYVPAGVRPELAAGHLPGVISAALDLEGIVGSYGPVIEMGLASIPVGKAEADTLPSGEVVDIPGMTQEEVDALKAMVRALTASVDRLDLGFATVGDMTHLGARFTVLPDSPLSPGPQPDFDRALNLTAMLPEGGNFLMAVAMDLGPQFEVFKDFYILNLEREAAGLGPERAAKYAAWFRDYVESMAIWAQPMAASYRFGDEGMIAHAVMESPDAEADVARLAEIIQGLSDVGMGLTLDALPDAKVGGTTVRNWSVTFDPETLTALSGEPANPKLAGMGRMQADQVSGILQKIVPGLSLAAVGDYVVMAADDDPSRILAMIEAVAEGGRPHEKVAAAAANAGPGVQEVVTGDLMTILKWVTAFMDEADREEMEVVMDNPIPFEATYTIEGRQYGMTMSMNMKALQELIGALDAMDQDEETIGDEDGPEGTGDEGGGEN